MKSKLRLRLKLLLTASIIITLSNDVNGQGLFKKIIKKGEEYVDKKTDEILKKNKKDSASKAETKNNTNESLNSIFKSDTIKTGKRPKLSEIYDTDFTQNTLIPTKNQDDTRYSLANNLAIDIKGKYPLNYMPKWRFINYASGLKVTVENWITPTANVRYQDYPLQIVSYNNKAVIRLQPFMNCQCFADIIIKDGFAVINEKPQTFQITNFRKILNDRSTGELCNAGTNWSDSWQRDGGLEGKITLSANENGDLLIDFMLEIYSSDRKNKKGELAYPSQVSLRYFAKGITVENEMSPSKANAIIAKEKEAKQKLKDYMTKTTRQADSIQKLIAKKYPENSCKECFYSSTGSYITSKTVNEYYVESGNYAGSRTEWDLNVKTEIKNKCNYDLLFIGIQQLYNEEKGYYLKEVTQTMEKGYHYSADQGAFANLFTSLMGAGSEFNIKLQDRYYPTYASVGSVQWLKVIKRK